MSKPAQPVPVAVKIGTVLLAAGLGAFLFLGDWRYAVAGVIALLASAVIGSPTKRGEA